MAVVDVAERRPRRYRHDEGLTGPAAIIAVRVSTSARLKASTGRSPVAEPRDQGPDDERTGSAVACDVLSVERATDCTIGGASRVQDQSALGLGRSRSSCSRHVVGPEERTNSPSRWQTPVPRLLFRDLTAKGPTLPDAIDEDLVSVRSGRSSAGPGPPAWPARVARPRSSRRGSGMLAARRTPPAPPNGKRSPNPVAGLECRPVRPDGSPSCHVDDARLLRGAASEDRLMGPAAAQGHRDSLVHDTRVRTSSSPSGPGSRRHGPRDPGRTVDPGRGLIGLREARPGALIVG
jgi:hypothetical protein